MNSLPKAYIQGCLIFGNVVILFILLNLVASVGGVFLKKSVDAPFENAKSLAFANERTRMDTLSLTQQKPVFRPYVHFGDPLFQSATLNIVADPRGIEIRKTAYSTDTFQDRVFLFGGNATFGLGVPDHETIASHLQKRLYDLKVVNYGRTNFNHYQAFTLLQRLLLRGAQPRAIIFLDSQTMAPPKHSLLLARLWQSIQFGGRPQLLPERLPLFRWINEYQRFQIRKRVLNLQSAHQEPQKSLEHYRSLCHMRYALAEQLGTPLLIIQQPTKKPNTLKMDDFRFMVDLTQLRTDEFNLGFLSEQSFTSKMNDLIANIIDSYLTNETQLL